MVNRIEPSSTPVEDDLNVLKFVWNYRFADGVIDHTISDGLDIPTDHVNAALYRLQKKGLVERFAMFTGSFAWRYAGRMEEDFIKAWERYNGVLNS